MKKLIAFVLVASPFMALAQSQINNINDVVSKGTGIGTQIIAIAISIAVIWIIINVVRYLIIGAGDPEKRKLAGHSILWGVIGLFVILSIWGLVYILRSSFQTQNTTPDIEIKRAATLPPVPTVQ